ncbi:porin family protein, partial [Methylobacterium sp. E-046]|nr:porin family protein [Methylobacterium sp. E-046]
NRSNNDGFTGGAQIGYNYQVTPGTGVVIGCEADAQYVDVSRRADVMQNYGVVGACGFGFSAPRGFVATSGNGLEDFSTVLRRLRSALHVYTVDGTGGFADVWD